MMRAFASLAALALAACGQNAANNVAVENAPAAANNSAAAAERVLRTETVSGTFTGWEMGDYLWGTITVPGREAISAQPGPTPVDLFLDANRGREVTVEVATVMANIPENGGPTEIQRITAARNAAGTAEAWWQGLSAADRVAAQRRFEQGALSGR
jgi:nucleoid-associated protein YgaU